MSEELTQVATAQVAPAAAAPVSVTVADTVTADPVVPTSSVGTPPVTVTSTGPTEVVTVSTEAATLPEPPAEIPVPEPAAEAQPKISVSRPGFVPKGNKPQTSAKKKPFAPRKAKVSPEERKALMKKNVVERGEFTDMFVDTLVDYATKNPGFDSMRNWGNALCTMFTRLGRNLREKMASFSPSDAEYMVKQLMQCLADEPLGSTVNSWREGYQSNGAQRKAIDKYFKIDGPLFRIADRDLVMIQVRNAAWPSIREEENNIGGTFAERFFYLAHAIVDFSMLDGLIEEMCSKAYHRRRAAWINEFGKCEQCDSEIVKDENGNDICSNKFCRHHLAHVSVGISKDFGRAVNRRPPRPDGNRPTGGGEARPVFDRPSGENKGPRREHGGGKDRRHDRHEDGDFEGMRGGKKHNKGRRFHENTEEIDPQHEQAQAPVEEGRTFFTSGSPQGGFGSLGTALDGLNLPSGS